MSETIYIELWGTAPAPQGSKNPWGGEANKNTKPWREAVASEAARVMSERGIAPLDGPVGLSIEFVFPRPKSHYRSNGELKPLAPKYKDSKPDLDKLLRAVGDALTSVAVRDDARIATLATAKLYTVPDVYPHPGISIRLYPVH